MRIALIADLHLSDVENTPQEETLDWALEELRRLQPDAAAWLGDITACGDPDAASRFCEKLQLLPFPSLILPGNADLRTPTTAPLLRRFLINYPRGLQVGDVRLVGVDTADDRISAGERERLARIAGGEDVLLTVRNLDVLSVDASRKIFGSARCLKKGSLTVIAHTSQENLKRIATEIIE